MTKKSGAAFIVASMVACNICTGVALPEKSTDPHYCGAGAFVEQTETIIYARKETEEYSMKGDLPNYTVMYGGTNCANIAGAIVIGYYDRFCENLIPNYKTYTQLGSIFRYKTEGAEIQQVISSLYSLMGTDQGEAGTRYNGFQEGMRAYATNHGYTYTIEDLGKLNFDKYKAAVESNKPVALFLSVYAMLSKNVTVGTSETVTSMYCTYAHVEVGCGYRVDTYYNANNQVITTRTYLKVASGFKNFNISYLCLDGKTTIDRAMAINIS